MGVHNKNLRIAVGLTLAAFILVFLAFVSPYWLVFDGQLQHPKFLNLGEYDLPFENSVFVAFVRRESTEATSKQKVGSFTVIHTHII